MKSFLWHRPPDSCGGISTAASSPTGLPFQFNIFESTHCSIMFSGNRADEVEAHGLPQGRGRHISHFHEPGTTPGRKPFLERVGEHIPRAHLGIYAAPMPAPAAEPQDPILPPTPALPPSVHPPRNNVREGKLPLSHSPFVNAAGVKQPFHYTC